MYFLSRVGISFASPSYSSQRFSNRCTVWTKGTFAWSPGAVTTPPTGRPNWVTIACSVSPSV